MWNSDIPIRLGKQIAETVIDGILVVNEQGDVIWCNDALVSMGGYQRSRMKSLNLMDLIVCSQIQGIGDLYRQDSFHQIECRMRTASGEFLAVLRSGKKFEVDQSRGLILALTDISKLIETKHQLDQLRKHHSGVQSDQAMIGPRRRRAAC